MQNVRLKFKLLRKDIVEAVKGTDQDFTNVSLGRAILLLAVPMVLEMIMESIFAIVDIFFVSKVGADAVAGVGITESLLTIVYSIAVGLSTATTALVARRIGEKNPGKASVTAFQAILAGSFISLFFAIPGIFLASDLLRLMGASPEVIETAHPYTAVMLGGNVIIMLLFVINAIFRSAGDAAISMRVLWLANIINMLLDPCLIFGLGPFPELGVEGAAIATVIGRGIAVVYQFILLFKGRGRVKLLVDRLKLDFAVMKQLLRVSMGGIGQSLLAHSSWIFLVRIIAIFGSDVLAGYTIAIRIVIFSLLPSWGLGNSASTLVGQNLGAKKPWRAERAVWITGFINMALLGIVGVIFVLFPAFFIRLFIDDPAVIKTGAVCLRIISYGYLAYAFGMVMTQAFNGAGDTVTPTWINLFCFWFLEIPLAWSLAVYFGVGEKGIYFAIVIAETMLAVVGTLLFRRGRWKTREV